MTADDDARRWQVPEGHRHRSTGRRASWCRWPCLPDRPNLDWAATPTGPA